ncbi:hypothetical protein JRC49_10940 [Clostridiales bacterium FE2011]|nr:hypothetical protein JRC49_10940 [Clostridiales bacterium FE2011]
MFTPSNSTIVPEPSPERVWQLATYLQKLDKPVKRDDLYKAMAMPEVYGENKGIFNDTLSVAKELDLVNEADGLISVSEELGKIRTKDDFRRYAARIVFQWEDSLFFRVTAFFCAHAEDMRKLESINDVVAYLGANGISIHDNVIKGWRLWAPFLGCGYLFGNVLIPNWQQRIADVLFSQQKWPKKQQIPFSEFITWLQHEAPETRDSIQGKQVGLGVSNGLRTLDELGVLKIVFTPDASQWQLVKTSGQNAVSYVQIMR